MTGLINELKKIASDSTVKTVAATLAVGGFLLNAVFGFGQTTLSLAMQGLGAAATLGMTAANAYKRQQEAQQNNQDDKPAKQSSALVQTLISSFCHVVRSANEAVMPRSENEATSETAPQFIQPLITSFFKKPVITSCGGTTSMSRKRRRNADDDMMDMAYGTDSRAGWTPWAKIR